MPNILEIYPSQWLKIYSFNGPLSLSEVWQNSFDLCLNSTKLALCITDFEKEWLHWINIFSMVKGPRDLFENAYLDDVQRILCLLLKGLSSIYCNWCWKYENVPKCKSVHVLFFCVYAIFFGVSCIWFGLCVVLRFQVHTHFP